MPNCFGSTQEAEYPSSHHSQLVPGYMWKRTAQSLYWTATSNPSNVIFLKSGYAPPSLFSSSEANQIR